jgi:hypothetical protein
MTPCEPVMHGTLTVLTAARFNSDLHYFAWSLVLQTLVNKSRVDSFTRAKAAHVCRYINIICTHVDMHEYMFYDVYL